MDNNQSEIPRVLVSLIAETAVELLEADAETAPGIENELNIFCRCYLKREEYGIC